VKIIQRAIHPGWPVGSLTCLRQWLTCPWPLPLSKTFLDVRDPRFSNKVRYPGVSTPVVAVCLSTAGVARFLLSAGRSVGAFGPDRTQAAPIICPSGKPNANTDL
jgi:hypothetical protein